MKQPKELDNLIEQVVEGFDNAICNDEQAEKWFKEGGELTVKFTDRYTDIKTQKGV